MKFSKVFILMLVVSMQGGDLVAQPHGNQDLYELVEACLGDCAVVVRPLLRLITHNQYAHKKDDDAVRSDLIGHASSVSYQDDQCKQKQFAQREEARLLKIEQLRNQLIIETAVYYDDFEQEKSDREFHSWLLPCDDILKSKSFVLKETGLDVYEDLGLPPLESCSPRIQKIIKRKDTRSKSVNNDFCTIS